MRTQASIWPSSACSSAAAGRKRLAGTLAYLMRTCRGAGGSGDGAVHENQLLSGGPNVPTLKRDGTAPHTRRQTELFTCGPASGKGAPYTTASSGEASPSRLCLMAEVRARRNTVWQARAQLWGAREGRCAR